MIYLDSNATTKLDERVARVIIDGFDSSWANSSSTHLLGRKAAQLVSSARSSVAALIGAPAHNVLFTSGATESLNLAILGCLPLNTGHPPHVITTAIEHSAVLEPIEHLEAQGLITVSTIHTNREGYITAQQVADSLRGDTALVAIGHGNNEIGVIQPMLEIGEVVRHHPAKFLVDAVQTLTYALPSVNEFHADFLAMSAHKMHGPQGVGALYARDMEQLRPLCFGGGQENGLRPGTLPTALIGGFGKAAELAKDEGKSRADEARCLARKLYTGLADVFPDITLNGPPLDVRLPGNLSITIPFVESDRLIRRLPDLAISKGSACQTSSRMTSHVLWAIGLREAELHWTIRIGVSSQTLSREIAEAVKSLCLAISHLRGRLPHTHLKPAF